MDQSEKMLYIAAIGYSRSHNVNLAKIAWMLSSITKHPENFVYHKLRDIDETFDSNLSAIYGIRKIANSINDDDVEDLVDDSLEKRVGEIVNVEVLSVKTFGAVCRVEDSTRTLLLHLSEVADEFITDLQNYLKEGQRLNAQLILNPKGDLGLSTKRVKPTNVKL